MKPLNICIQSPEATGWDPMDPIMCKKHYDQWVKKHPNIPHKCMSIIIPCEECAQVKLEDKMSEG